MSEEVGGTRTVTVLLCDLVGSTARQARLGDDAFDAFRRRFFAALGEAVTTSGGEVVKNTGDGLLVVFRHSAVDAVMCAVGMHERVEALDPDDPARLRIGISAGEVAHENDDWYGTPVVEAARLETAAGPGGTLASEVVRRLVGTRGGFTFRPAGQLELKGLPAPVATVEVVRAGVAPVRHARRRRRVSPLVLVVAIVVVIALVAAGIALTRSSTSPSSAATPKGKGLQPAVGYMPQYRPGTCPAEDRREIRGVQCGTLIVPEDRTHPNNKRVVELGVRRAPARRGATLDPVLDFGADNLATSPVREHAEEIQLGQRGFFGSKPHLTCPEYSRIAPDTLTMSSRDPRIFRDASAAFARCRARLLREHVDLTHYTFVDNGDDMLDLMRALSLRRVNLVSGYIETIAALQVLRVAPGAVATLTLQSPVAPNRSGLTDPTDTLNTAFKRYVALCKQDAACGKAFPDLPGRFREGVLLYDRAPVMAEGDDGNGHKHAVLLDGDRLAQAVWAGLFNRDVYRLLASGIQASSSKAIDKLAAGQVLLYDDAFLEEDFAWGAMLSARCSYDANTIDAGRVLVDQTLPEFSGVDTGFIENACKAWNVPKLAAAFAFDDSVEYDTPALLVFGALAPEISTGWSSILTASMPNATSIIFPTLDGNVVNQGGPRCFADLRRAFLANPSASLPVAACEAQSPPIHFVAG